jgi:hypothetical protein
VTRKIAWLALVIWGFHTEAAGQGFEAGGGIARGCTGDSSGFCSDETGPMWSVHAGFWITEHVQIAVRFAALPLDDFSHSTPRDDRFSLADDQHARSLARIDITLRERSRHLGGGELLYYFAGAGRIGFVLGAGLGELSNPQVKTCAPAGCESVLRAVGSPVGRTAGRTGNLTWIAGVSGPATTRLRISGGVRLHNLAGENNSTTEAFLTAGIRF